MIDLSSASAVKRVRVMTCNTRGEIGFADVDGLRDMQQLVGGLITLVACGDVDCYVNDEGLLDGLDPNPTAVAICKSFGSDPGYLVGDAFFTGGVDAEGNTLPIDRESACKAATVAITARIEAAVSEGRR